jgi:SAUR family protein
MVSKLYHLIRRLDLSRSQTEAFTDVPKGHFPVYVGESRKRFVIPTTYLKHPSFLTLLKRVEEEFGFQNQLGGLALPCEECYFMAIVADLKCSLQRQK